MKHPTIIQGHEIAGRMPLFKPELRQANRDGRKTMTRRVPSRINSLVDGYGAKKDYWEYLDFDNAWVDPGPSPAGNAGPYLKVPMPFGETVHRVYPRFQVGDIRVMCEPYCRFPSNAKDGMGEGLYYRDDQPNRKLVKEIMARNGVKWISSMHMPHEAARSLFEITGIGCGRVQDISLNDVRAEGIYHEWDGTKYWFGSSATDPAMTPHFKWVFKELWDSIYGPGAWERNDWVWDYTYKGVA